jgi:dihydrofolate synthase/folylpolyglutamate synthase
MSDSRKRTSKAQGLRDYHEALRRTNDLVDRSPTQPKNPADVRARAEQRLARLRALLSRLGNPHLAFRVIHVGGTSGKGSTSAAIAAILTAGGIRTGLHTSPYLQVATEKIQLDGRLIDGMTLLEAVETVLHAAQDSGVGRITYGEAWFAMVALIFARANVEIGVIEVGAGGRFDLTNVVEPAVSVITSVGLDHMETLGATIPEIAWHKAGIIKNAAPVVSAVTDPDALDVIRREAEIKQSTLHHVLAGETFGAMLNAGGSFDWWELQQSEIVYPTSMPGRFQATNSATALVAVRLIEPEIARNPEIVRRGLLGSRLQGRYETMSACPAVILDGAHNPQKMAALARDLRQRKKSAPESRLIAVVGVLEAKDHLNVLREIVNVADELVTTSPRVLAKPGAKATALARDARELGFSGPVLAIDDPLAALDTALDRSSVVDTVVVTGSLYLVGNVRGRWYPDDEIILQQTAWPEGVSPEFPPRERFSFRDR